jgi:hypothetical protein
MLKKLEILKKFVEGTAKGYAYSLIAVSQAGTGKTETTLNSLKELGLKEEKHFIYINSYITPLELYHQLKRTNDLVKPKILILDDCEDIFSSNKTASLLKGALWQLPNGIRKVCWFSTSPKVKDTSFLFEGRIILLLNSFNRKNPIINAIADRGYYYEFRLTNDEILSLIRELAKKGYKGLTEAQQRKVVNFLMKYGLNSEKISLRILEQAYRLFLLSPNHWQQLTSELLK